MFLIKKTHIFLKKKIKSIVFSTLENMNFVGKENFDMQKKILISACQKLEVLEKKVEKIIQNRNNIKL